jgi:hypothetical protein
MREPSYRRPEAQLNRPRTIEKRPRTSLRRPQGRPRRSAAPSRRCPRASFAPATLLPREERAQSITDRRATGLKGCARFSARCSSAPSARGAAAGRLEGGRPSRTRRGGWSSKAREAPAAPGSQPTQGAERRRAWSEGVRSRAAQPSRSRGAARRTRRDPTTQPSGGARPSGSALQEGFLCDSAGAERGLAALLRAIWLRWKGDHMPRRRGPGRRRGGESRTEPLEGTTLPHGAEGAEQPAPSDLGMPPDAAWSPRLSPS